MVKTIRVCMRVIINYHADSDSVMVQMKGWYSKLQRDEVVAEWKKVQGKMTLHVHCHISGGNLMHNLIANLRFYIFRKELPVVRISLLHLRHLFSVEMTNQNGIRIRNRYDKALSFSFHSRACTHRARTWLSRYWRHSDTVMKNFWKNILVNPLDVWKKKGLVVY